jgi:hypothetical protein
MATTIPLPDQGKQRINKVRQLVLKSSQYTTVPNWLLDVGLRVIPYEASHLFLYLSRKIIGYSNSDGTLQRSIGDIAFDTGVNADTVSRWAQAFSYIGFIHYEPAANGVRTSSFQMYPHGLPTSEQVHAAVSGIASAVKKEAELRKQTNRQRIGAKDFAEVVRGWTIHWRLKNARPEEHQAIKNRIESVRKGLI